jgi:hypothetical protein
MTYVKNLAKVVLHVDSRHTCDHHVDASIKTMKYLNDHDNGCIDISLNSFKKFKWLNLNLER